MKKKTKFRLGVFLLSLPLLTITGFAFAQMFILDFWLTLGIIFGVLSFAGCVYFGQKLILSSYEQDKENEEQ